MAGIPLATPIPFWPDGTSWTAVQAPPTGYGYLASVTCSTLSACLAVGAQKVTSVSEEPLAETSG